MHAILLFFLFFMLKAELLNYGKIGLFELK